MVNEDDSLQALSDLESNAMSDLFFRLIASCRRKCVESLETDRLVKEEAVCADRCVAKFMDLHERVGKKLSHYQMTNEEVINRLRPETFVVPTTAYSNNESSEVNPTTIN